MRCAQTSTAVQPCAGGGGSWPPTCRGLGLLHEGGVQRAQQLLHPLEPHQLAEHGGVALHDVLHAEQGQGVTQARTVSSATPQLVDKLVMPGNR